MQIKLYTIPIIGGESLTAEMNAFLRSHKVLKVDQELITSGDHAFWCFAISYLSANQASTQATKAKVDYRKVLDADTFARFARLREIRKRVAQEDAVPAFAVFTDQELAELAKLEPLTLANMQQVKGIGAKKVEKYGQHFV